MTEISTGTRLFDMILNHDIPRTLKVGQSRVKVWYRDQPLQCDICNRNHKKLVRAIFAANTVSVGKRTSFQGTVP